MSRNKFTKVEVTSAPSLAKLYGPDTRRTGLAIVRVIMLRLHSFYTGSLLFLSMAASGMLCAGAASCASDHRETVYST